MNTDSPVVPQNVPNLEKHIPEFLGENDERLDLIYKMIINQQMLYHLASLDWVEILNDIKTNKHFSLTTNFVSEISKELKEFFIHKLNSMLEKQFSSKKEFSDEDNKILHILINQIKNKKPEETSVKQETIVSAPIAIDNPVVQGKVEPQKIVTEATNSGDLKKALEENKERRRMTISNNPHRKPPASPHENQIRAIAESQAIASIAGQRGIGGLQVTPAMSEGDSAVDYSGAGY